MRFRKTISSLCCLVFFIGMGRTYAQDAPTAYIHINKFSGAVSGGHYGYDPAIGVELTTPSFYRNHLRFRVRANLQWLEAYKATYQHWARYYSYSAALVYHSQILDRARFYVELGTFAIVPEATFSEKRFLQGFYEFNGLEIFLISTSHYNLAFYLGIGPMFIEAYADKLERRPRYGNGIQYSNGVRIYF